MAISPPFKFLYIYASAVLVMIPAEEKTYNLKPKPAEPERGISPSRQPTVYVVASRYRQAEFPLK